MKIIASILIVCIIPTMLISDYSSLTDAERTNIVTAVEMAGEYRYLLDGAETKRIVEAINVTGEKWRVRIELGMKKSDGTYRYIVRDIYIDIHSNKSTSWPWIIMSGAVGIVAGILIAK